MEKKSRAIENFKEMVLVAAAAHMKRPLTAAEKSRIEDDIDSKSQILSHTPNHPPYAAMIYEAIRELNSISGSSEEAISNFIRSKHLDLPYHHSACLKLYLRKQCDKKEICMTPDNRYIFAHDGNGVVPPDQTVGVVKVNKNPKETNIAVREVQKVPTEDIHLSKMEQQKPKGRGRGMVPEVATEGIRLSEMEQKPKGRGEANKQVLEQVPTADLILSLQSNNSQQLEMPKRRGRGRPRKLG